MQIITTTVLKHRFSFYPIKTMSNLSEYNFFRIISELANIIPQNKKTLAVCDDVNLIPQSSF